MRTAVLGAALRRSNRLLQARDAVVENPRPLDVVDWDVRLRAAWPEIRAEWDRFVAAGGRLPRIEEVLDEPQGNSGAWRAGLLISAGRPVGGPARHFPATVGALGHVPGLRSALWSVLGPGAELPEHCGPNAGVLRYHLGVDCGDDAALRVGDRVVPYRDGHSVLFDDTFPHAAWNHGTHDRVTLFCDMVRPVPAPWSQWNQLVQGLLGADPRYRLAPARAATWDAALNPRLAATA